MMDALGMLAAVGGLWMVAVATPGPNALLVARLAVVRGRGAGLAAVGGIGLGTLAWSLSGFFGVHLLFLAAPLLYRGLMIAGALWLVWLGVRLLAGSFVTAGAPREAAGATFRAGGFRAGLLTSLSNPKSMLLVGSLFAAVMPHGAPWPLGLAAVAEMVAISLAWYGAVVLLLSAPRAASVYARAGRWLDRAAGAIFIGFGLAVVEREL
jgi:threonine/homoserine/homoserine lactone efflux protein